jgi:hydrogenase nickel incorporation protein HypA/HybF
MHELGIAQSVIETVQKEAALRPEASPTKIAVRIGELAAVDPDALQFSFEALTAGTELEGVRLEIEVCPRRHRCLDCGAEFNIKDLDFRCTACQSTHNECISGDQIELAYLELEEHEPSSA